MVIFLLLFINFTYATTIDYEKFTFYLYENTTSRVILHINFTDITTYNISYFVLDDVRNLRAYDKNGEIKCTLNKESIGTEISCYKRSEKQSNASIILMYYTNTITPKQDYLIFRYAIPVIYPTKKIEVEAYLPEGAVVVNSENFETITPKPTKIGSDEKGRRFKIEWILNEPQLGKTYTFNIYYELRAQPLMSEKSRIFYIISSLIVVSLILLVAIYYFLKKQKEEKVINILIEDEKKVLDAIKELGEGCKQKDVVKYTGFSKAKVSRIVEELKKRNIIEVEKVGKHNKLYLKK